MKSRGIEFRVWDPIYKNMDFFLLEDFLLGRYPKQYIYLPKENCQMVGDSLRKDIIFMQYTGIKDNNGHKIFDEDILRDTATYGDLGPLDGIIEEIPKRHKDSPFGAFKVICPLLVTWAEGNAGWCAYNNIIDKEYPYTEFNLGQQHFEVIGNIYETPELYFGEKE